MQRPLPPPKRPQSCVCSLVPIGQRSDNERCHSPIRKMSRRVVNVLITCSKKIERYSLPERKMGILESTATSRERACGGRMDITRAEGRVF